MEYSFRYRRRLTKPPTLPPPAQPLMRPPPLLVIERIAPTLLDDHQAPRAGAGHRR